MKTNKHKISKKDLDLEISNLYTTRASGATLPHPEYFPKILIDNKFMPRNSRYNVLLGTTITHPDTNRYLLGITYWDLTENKDNEDLFEIDMLNETIEAGYKGAFDKKDPLYKGTHKDGKKYLLSPQKKVEIFIKRQRFNLEKLLSRK